MLEELRLKGPAGRVGTGRMTIWRYGSEIGRIGVRKEQRGTAPLER